MSQCFHLYVSHFYSIDQVNLQGNEDLLAVEDKGKNEPDDDIPYGLEEKFPVYRFYLPVNRKEPVKYIMAQVDHQRIHT